MQEKENIIRILQDSKGAVREKNTARLKQLSNRTIHTASIYQDSDNVTIAVIIYSLSKLIEREKHYSQYKNWPNFFKTYVLCINQAIRYLKKDNIEDFRQQISKIRQAINQLSGHLKKYIKDVFRKASINKASRIYEHGISMGTTARLLGISIWELAEYAGQTSISDANLGVTMPIKERIKLIEDFFRK